MGELRRLFGGASNGAVQQALQPLKASGAVATRGPQGGHFIGLKAAAEPRNVLRELRSQLEAAAVALRAAGSLLGELENDRGA